MKSFEICDLVVLVLMKLIELLMLKLHVGMLEPLIQS